MITIFETLYLLALDEEDGGIPKSVQARIEPLLAGAVLIELVLYDRVGIKDNRLIVQDQTPTDHLVLDISLSEILESSKARKLNYWINTLTYENIMDEIEHSLIKEGILVRKKKHLWMDASNGEPANGKVSVQTSLRTHLSNIVMDGEKAELADKALLSLLYYSDLLKLVFVHGGRKAARKQIKRMIEPDEGETVLGYSIDEIVAVACEAIA